jgi:hypothetical protein
MGGVRALGRYVWSATNWCEEIDVGGWVYVVCRRECAYAHKVCYVKSLKASL